jgi:hypothetical protein
MWSSETWHWALLLFATVNAVILGGVFFSLRNFLKKNACATTCKDHVDEANNWLTALLGVFVFFVLMVAYNLYITVLNVRYPLSHNLELDPR